ncbi:hypothetical protein ACFQQB_03650 [Nonomuraea rubra]|uniref:hypothetical protein n=1 Tax=Nonomuraea rubra TaxID=46180 RepID=UPI00361DCD0C
MLDQLAEDLVAQLVDRPLVVQGLAQAEQAGAGGQRADETGDGGDALGVEVPGRVADRRGRVISMPSTVSLKFLLRLWPQVPREVAAGPSTW